MSKKVKIFVIVAVVVAVLTAGFFIARDFVVDVVFDKIYGKVVDEMIEKEKNEKPEKKPEEKLPEKIVGEDGEEYELADEDDETAEEIKGQDGETHKVKKPYNSQNTEKSDKPLSSTQVAIKQISELTPQELQEIQALVTTADKMAAINIVKSALTAADKREIKAMLESGKIDYGRCMQIASQRLSVEQKKQIYAYYDKYAKIYFAGKQ